MEIAEYIKKIIVNWNKKKKMKKIEATNKS